MEASVETYRVPLDSIPTYELKLDELWNLGVAGHTSAIGACGRWKIYRLHNGGISGSMVRHLTDAITDYPLFKRCSDDYDSTRILIGSPELQSLFNTDYNTGPLRQRTISHQPESLTETISRWIDFSMKVAFRLRSPNGAILATIIGLGPGVGFAPGVWFAEWYDEAYNFAEWYDGPLPPLEKRR